MIENWLQQYRTNGVSLSLQELLLFKQKHRGFDLSPKSTIQGQLSGGYLAHSKGRGMEFDEARHYQAGDDIRAIDWRVTARTGKTHTKLYREEKERPVFIAVDLCANMQFGTQWVFKSVQAAHLTSALAWAAKARGDRVGGIVFNDHNHLEFKPVNRQKGVLAMLNGLIQLQQQQQSLNCEPSTDTLLQGCARLRRLAHPGSLIFVISDFSQMSDQVAKHLQRLTQHCEVICYHISDPFENSLPSTDKADTLAIDCYGEESLITLGETRSAAHYQQQQQRRYDKLTSELERCRCKVFAIDAGSPLLAQVKVV